MASPEFCSHSNDSGSNDSGSKDPKSDFSQLPADATIIGSASPPSTKTFNLPSIDDDAEVVSRWFEKMITSTNRALDYRQGNNIVLGIAGSQLRKLTAKEIEVPLRKVFDKETAKTIADDIVSARNEKEKMELSDEGSVEHQRQEPSESSGKSKRGTKSAFF